MTCVSIGKQKANGVGTLFKKEIQIIWQRETILGRILMVDIYFQMENVWNTKCLYPLWQGMRLFNNLILELSNVGYGIICGHYNTITVNKDTVAYKDLSITREDILLKRICELSNMKDTFRELHPNKQDFIRMDNTTKTKTDKIQAGLDADQTVNKQNNLGPKKENWRQI